MRPRICPVWAGQKETTARPSTMFGTLTHSE